MKKNKVYSVPKRAVFFLLGLFSVGLFLGSCSSNEPDELAPLVARYASGVLITNEGPFLSGSGSITFYDPRDGAVEQNVFERANGRVLGNIVQSVNIHEGRAYIVVNNAEKVEVASAETFRSEGTIEGLAFPRYFVGLTAEKGYVSQWGPTGTEGSVQVIDLATNRVVKQIAVGRGANRMLLINNRLFVACNGGFGNDNRVFVINTTTDAVEREIEVGANPNSLQQDQNGNVWVLCGGRYRSDFTGLAETAELFRLNAQTLQVTGAFPFDDFSNPASDLVVSADGRTLFFLKGGSVFSAAATSGEQLTLELLVPGFFYGLGYDAVDRLLYLADAKDFVGNGSVLQVEENGNSVGEIPAGVIPNGGFYFSKE